jgi:1-acyl-sn-glycerol-3-phosphate acyltransferase
MSKEQEKEKQEQERQPQQEESVLTMEEREANRRALNRKNCRSGVYRVFHALLSGPVRLFGRIRVVGRENEPRRGDGPYLVICNHLTWADPVILCAALSQQQPHFMAKKELFRIPVFGQLIRALGAYPVDRGGADVGAIRRTIHMLENGVTVGMFPQGHRYNGEDPRKTPVKSGAAMIALRAGVPVLPVYIKVKDNTVKAFRKRTIIIGKPITVQEMQCQPREAGEFRNLIEMLFERVCALGDDAPDRP